MGKKWIRGGGGGGKPNCMGQGAIMANRNEAAEMMAPVDFFIAALFKMIFVR